MSHTNQQTIDTYNARAREYIDGTPPAVVVEQRVWIDANLAKLDKRAKILEIGTAFGRDAAYMESKGFTVTRTDASVSFVRMLREQGYQADMFNVLTDPIEGTYAMIFANAVLLHFTPAEVRAVLAKVYTALPYEGRFVFSVKNGDGEEWSGEKLGAPRYFCYWQLPDIIEELYEAGFSSVEGTMTERMRSGKRHWLLLTAVKGKA